MADGILKAEYNDAELQSIMNALSKASMPDLADIASFAGGELEYISKKAFENEKDPVTGINWEPLKYPRPKPKKGETNPILNFGGQLKRSLCFEAYPDGSVIFGSNMEYARIHQRGGQAGRERKSTIPARPYMGVTKDFDRRILSDPAVLKLLGLST